MTPYCLSTSSSRPHGPTPKGKGVGPHLSRLADDNFTAPLEDPLSCFGIIAWYDGLVTKLQPHNVALLPFDCILLPGGADGLCPPGVGSIKHAAMSTALFTFLAHVLPPGDRLCEWQLNLGQNSNQNGYVVIYNLFKKSVPGFCITATNAYPNYTDFNSITGFASAVMLFYRIELKSGHQESSVAMSRKFLSMVQHLAWLSPTSI